MKNQPIDYIMLMDGGPWPLILITKVSRRGKDNCRTIDGVSTLIWSALSINLLPMSIAQPNRTNLIALSDSPSRMMPDGWLDGWMDD